MSISREKQLENNPDLKYHQGYALRIVHLKQDMFRLEMKKVHHEAAYQRAYDHGYDSVAIRHHIVIQKLTDAINHLQHKLLSIYEKIKVSSGQTDITHLISIGHQPL